jgi:signal recognition particle receptor subunit beta
MVFFNYATMQMAAKIVYYGPGLCGKTTNLHVIYGRTAPNSRGEMVSLETETDRTLFFDLLPIDVGVIGGFKTRLQLYTVPGQVFYNTTRKLVLKGLDGIVFVADSQIPMLDANRESLRNLHENLAEIGVSLSDTPLVLQYNKRDLSNILSPEEMHSVLNPEGALQWFEASARDGVGVFETLKGISKLTLRSLSTKMTGEPRRPTAMTAIGRGVVVPPPWAPAPAPDVAETVFPNAALEPSPAPHLERTRSASASPNEEAPNVAFVQASTPPSNVSEDGEVKHVRVRSTVDILSELDKLRKLATQRPASPSDAFPALASGAGRPALGKRASLSIDDLLSPGASSRRDVSRSFDLSIARAALSQTHRVTVILRFNGGPGGHADMTEREVTVDLPAAHDLRKLLLSLKFNVQAE